MRVMINIDVNMLLTCVSNDHSVTVTVIRLVSDNHSVSQ